MKSRETLIRLKRFQVDEKRRQVAQIEAMMAEFERMAADLDREILAEQERAGISDVAQYAYPTYARAAMQRRDNLKRSADELQGQLAEAQAELGEAFEELKKVELLDERDGARERAANEAREQAALDEMGLDAHRRRAG
jgi:flagellar export protein FliJ